VKSHAYRIVNVFTRGGRLTGNPLCVFEEGDAFDDAAMQALARQFNLSETTFILRSSAKPQQVGDPRVSARVRIFTPAYEMPFAGHPTLGTAHVARALGLGGDRLRLEMKAGVIPVEADGDRWTLAAREPRVREPAESRAQLADAVGLRAEDLAQPALWVNAGTEQLMLPVKSREAVARARPMGLGELQSAEPVKAYVFFDEGDAARKVTARFFFPAATGIAEDPATGSACANLGGWFRHVRPGEDVERVVSQGDAIARPSTLYLAVKAGAVSVGGDVIELGRGTIEL
jgi:trans-2,3-dihydro-3-hydroxyanthranilate isomerase